jgi:hypothetical protein
VLKLRNGFGTKGAAANPTKEETGNLEHKTLE